MLAVKSITHKKKLQFSFGFEYSYSGGVKGVNEELL